MTLSPSTDFPGAHTMQRNADGRLTGLVIDSQQALPTNPDNVWLIAIDGSSHAQHAVAETLRLTRRRADCALHLVHVEHWLSKEAAENELARRGWAVSHSARALLDGTGHPWRLHVAMGECAENIVRIAREINCRQIVVGSRGLSSTEDLLLGSVAHQVIHLSPVSVLVVR